MGKKRTHRVRGASLSPRGTEQDGAGAADEATEAGAAIATPAKTGGEPELADSEGTPLQAPGTPDESAESSGLSPRTLSRGSTLPIMLPSIPFAAEAGSSTFSDPKPQTGVTLRSSNDILYAGKECHANIVEILCRWQR